MLAIDEHPQGRDLDTRATVADQLRATFRPARPVPAAERGQLDALRGTRACRRSRGRSSGAPTRRVAPTSPGVVGVVGGDVLEEPGQRLEPQSPGGIDVAEVHPAGGTEHPPARGQVDELGRHDVIVARRSPAVAYQAGQRVRRNNWGSVSAWSPTKGRTVSGFLDRLGRRAVRHHWWFIGVWVVATVVIVGARGRRSTVSSATTSASRAPSRSRRSTCSRTTSRGRAGDSALVVFESSDGITSSSVEPAISESVAALEQDPARHDR